MPSKDPKTGKVLGGAAKARRRTAAREHERARTAAAPLGGFEDLEPPPENTAKLVTWAAQLTARALYRATQDRTLFESEKDALRFILDGAKALGMIRDKAKEQEDLAAAEKVAKASAATKAAGTKPLAGINKPETARRAAAGGGA